MRGGSLRCSWTHKYLTEKLFFDVSTLTISRCLVVQLVVVEIGRVKLYTPSKKKSTFWAATCARLARSTKSVTRCARFARSWRSAAR